MLELSPVFDGMYSKRGRYSIPPERLLMGTLLMALHSVRSERLFCEQLDHNLLRRCLTMDVDEPSFDHSTFSFNRERLLKREVAGQFFAAVVSQAKAAGRDDAYEVEVRAAPEDAVSSGWLELELLP